MLEYEEFLLESFPKAFDRHFQEVEAATPCVIEKARKRAINYLEYHCSSKYGFYGEGHTDRDMSKSNSIYMVPTSYDSGLLLPYLVKEGVDPLTTDALVSVLKRSQRKSEFWNYFFDPEHKTVSLFPDDVDDTSVPLMALYLTGNISLEECQRLAKKMLQNKMDDDETGAISTWISGNQRTIVFDRYLTAPKLCAGCLINFLWFLSTIGMDTEPDVTPSIYYVDKFVDKLVGHKGIDGVELPGMCYYTNRYVIYMFISRFLDKSQFAQDLMGKKFLDLLLFEFDMIVEKNEPEALDIACMILAVTHLKLHKIEGQKWIMDFKRVLDIQDKIKKLCDILLTLQSKDGSFRAWVVYRWNRLGHWGGSKPYSTGLALAALGIAKREVYAKVNGKVD